MFQTVSTVQRLHTLENEIRSGLEEFYHTAMKLKEIRDNELYKADNFATWDEYLRDRWEYSREYVHRLITAGEYRERLPVLPSGQHAWSERAVRELTRIPDKRQAARVAAKVLQEVEGTKGGKLTAKVVRRHVDHDLGVKREKPKPEPKDEGIDPERFLRIKTGEIQAIRDHVSDLPGEVLEQIRDELPNLIEELVEACETLCIHAVGFSTEGFVKRFTSPIRDWARECDADERKKLADILRTLADKIVTEQDVFWAD